MKKVAIALITFLLILTACSSEGKRTISEDERIYNIMVSAEKDGRNLTEEESSEIYDFYVSKPLENRGTELDYTLNMMFNTFGTDDFDTFKERASKELNK